MKNNRLSKKTVFIYALMLGFAVIFLLGMLGDYSDFSKAAAKVNTVPAASARELPPAMETPPRPVRFNFTDADAQQVLLAADFNNWGAHEIILDRTAQNTFSKTIVLPPGEYKYYFIVDGSPQRDSAAANNISYEGQEVSIKKVL